MTDSVVIIAEGSVEDQLYELATFIARAKPEEERASFLANFQHNIKTAEGKTPLEEDTRRKKLILNKIIEAHQFISDATDKEIEGFYNLFFSYVFDLLSGQELDAAYTGIIRKITATPNLPRLPLLYRIQTNLFNSLPRNSPYRKRLVRSLLAAGEPGPDSEKGVKPIKLEIDEVKKWLEEWDLPNDQKADFLLSVYKVYKINGYHDLCFKFFLLYVENLEPVAAADNVPLAIGLALSLPGVYDFESLLALEVVRSVRHHPAYKLLDIFRTKTSEDLEKWIEQNGETITFMKLDVDEMRDKFELFTLSGLAAKYVGQNLPYSKIAETLEIEESDVESWVIDVIRAGLVSGKLSQTTQSLHVVRATPRTFEKEQWQVLEKRLQAWKQGLAGVLEVVANAKRQASA